MTMWTYLPDRKLSTKEAREVPKEKKCLACAGKLLRVAERADYFPYVWVPNGYICSKCNAMVMGVA